MKILVTGGQGFLGRRLVTMLVERGWAVRAFCRRPEAGLAALGVEIHQGDLRDPAAVRAAVAGCGGVVHTAARSGVWGDPADYLEANFFTTLNLLEAARRGDPHFLVHTSSPSVVHTGAPLAGVDESAPYGREVRLGYAHSKMLAERLVLAADSSECRTVALRPHLIWGPGDPHFLPRLLARARRGRLWLFKGSPLVDGVYVDNAALAHLLAVEKLAAGAALGGRAYFIAQDEPRPVDRLVAELIAAAAPGEGLRVRGLLPPLAGLAAARALEWFWRLGGLAGEPPLTRFVVEELTRPHWFSLAAARADLGYRPSISVAEGLRRLSESALQQSSK